MGHTTTNWTPSPAPLPTSTIEALAAEAVRLGREVAEGMHRHCVGSGSTEHATTRRCVARLAEGEALDLRDEASLDLVAGILAADLATETLGERRVFKGTVDPEGHDIGDVETILLTTERGQSLIGLSDKLSRFRHLRRAVLDKAAADRSLRRILSM